MSHGTVTPSGAGDSDTTAVAPRAIASRANGAIGMNAAKRDVNNDPAVAWRESAMIPLTV